MPRLPSIIDGDRIGQQRARYMTLETIAALGDDQTIMLPIAAA
jgi:hypothetical protein